MPITAVRTVSEDDRWRVIEGLAVPFGGPFGGRDTYNTFFSKRTDFGLATRSDAGVPIPVWFQHGLDPDFRFDTIGLVDPSAWRLDDDGVWVQAQIDKRHRYYETRVKPLLDSTVGDRLDRTTGAIRQDGPAVGLSAGSAEHSQVISQKNREVLAYPIHEISLTPTESNVYATVAIRSDGEPERLVVAFRAAPGGPSAKERESIPDEDFAGKDKSYPITDPGSVKQAADSIGRAGPDNYSTDELKANIIKIAKRKGAAYEAKLPKAWQDDASRSAAFRAWCEAAVDASQGASILAQLLLVINDESDEPDQVAMLQKAADSLSEWIAAERAEIDAPDTDDIVDALTDLANLASQTAADLAVPVAVASYLEPAIRAGKRNSAADAERITSIGQHASAISEHVTALTTDSQPADDSDDAAARSADAAAQPAEPFVVAVRSHADPYEQLRKVAENAGRERALALLQR